MVTISSRRDCKTNLFKGRFTKRLVGLHNMTYAERVGFLKLDSLEVRRIRFDIIFSPTCKILFGLVNMNSSDMFAFNDFTATRGHDTR